MTNHPIRVDGHRLYNGNDLDLVRNYLNAPTSHQLRRARLRLRGQYALQSTSTFEAFRWATISLDRSNAHRGTKRRAWLNATNADMMATNLRVEDAFRGSYWKKKSTATHMNPDELEKYEADVTAAETAWALVAPE